MVGDGTAIDDALGQLLRFQGSRMHLPISYDEFLTYVRCHCALPA